MSIDAISGLAHTGNIGDDIQVRDVAPDIRLLEPDNAPLCSILMNPKMTERPLYSTIAEWADDIHFPFRTALAASYTNVATSITVATGTGAYYQEGDTLLNEHTGEQLFVNGAPTGDSIPVQRGLGSTTNVASSGTSDSIIKLGHSSAQGAGAPIAKQTKPAFASNYVQDFRKSVDQSDLELGIRTYGQDQMSYQDAKAADEHKRERDRAMFLQHRHQDTDADGRPRGHLGGILDYVQSNVAVLGTSLSQAVWETHVSNAFRYGSATAKIAFVSPMVMAQINGFASGRVQPANAGVLKTWGVQVKTYTATTGEVLPFVVNKHWGDAPQTPQSTRGMALIVDMSNIKRRPFNGKDTTLLKDREPRDETRKLREWRTVETLEVRQEATHYLVRDIRPAA